MSLQDLLEVVPAGTGEQDLLRAIDFTRLPRHVAVIMDGNGRWAQLRQKRRVEGHRAGIDAVRDTVETAARLGIEVLTLYAFSIENWKRPESEIATLMGLLKHYLRSELDTLLRNNIRFRVVGRGHELDPDVRGELERAVLRTATNSGLQFNIALNYGGRAEIIDAVRSLVAEGATGDKITEKSLRRHLYDPDMPDPDLVVRTSGEYRISNFLLWEQAYSELVFTDVLWPDFRRENLFDAVREFQSRERRFGGVQEPS